MIHKSEENATKTIANTLNNKGVCIIPTDTVYGLIANAMCQEAIFKIYDVKKREPEKKLAVFCKNIDQIKEICEVNDEVFNILKALLPGKFTFILNAKKTAKISLISNFGYQTLGVRISNDEFILNILHEFNKPIAATSANISNEKDTSIFQNLSQEILGFADLVTIDDNLLEKKPSCVIDLTNFQSGSGFSILRFGDEAPAFVNFLNKKYKKDGLRRLKNIGPAMEKAMIKCGIFNKDEFLKQDFVIIYKKFCNLNDFFKHKMVFYALFGAANNVNCVKIPVYLKEFADKIWDELETEYKKKKKK